MRAALVPLLIAAIGGGAVGALGGSWMVRKSAARQENLHDIVHKRFDLTAEEHRRLDAAEARYTAQRAAIEARIQAANLDLAAAIRADQQLSPSVLKASAAVEAAAAELQNVTLRHIFEMREALEPAHRADYDRVLVTALAPAGSGR